MPLDENTQTERDQIMKTLHCYGNWNWIVLPALFVEFKYDEKKRLTEKDGFLSNGEMRGRYVYKYEGTKRRSWSTQRTARSFGAIFTYSTTKAM